MITPYVRTFLQPCIYKPPSLALDQICSKAKDVFIMELKSNKYEICTEYMLTNIDLSKMKSIHSKLMFG